MANYWLIPERLSEFIVGQRDCNGLIPGFGGCYELEVPSLQW